MSQPSDDRRLHPRREAALPIVLSVELHGFDTSSTRFEAIGRTCNLSHGGLLAHVDHEVDRGGRLLAHFPDATGTLGRTMMFGTVSRCTRAGDHWEVAVIFDTPLVDIELRSEATE